MFRMAGQTAGPIETKLDTRTHVHPGSVSGKVNVKVIHVCLRERQKYETPAKRHLANDAHTMFGRLAEATPSERLRNAVVLLTRRGVKGAEQRAPQAGAELRPEDGYLQLVSYKLLINLFIYSPRLVNSRSWLSSKSITPIISLGYVFAARSHDVDNLVQDEHP